MAELLHEHKHVETFTVSISPLENTQVVGGTTSFSTWQNVFKDTPKMNNIMGVDIVNAFIPNNQSNVNAYNNTLYYFWNEDGKDAKKTIAQRTITIPVGQYTYASLGTAVCDAINVIETALASGFSVTSPPNTTNADGCIRITCAGGTLLALTNWGATADYLTGDVWSLLGVKPTTAFTPPAGESGTWYSQAAVTNVLTGTSLPQLTGTQYVFLHSPEVFSKNIMRNNSTEDCMVIPINVSFGSVSQFRPQTREETIIWFQNPKDMSNISIAIRDRYHRPVDMKGSAPVITLRLYRQNDI